MPYIETQEAIITKAFFDELEKNAGRVSTFIDTFRTARHASKAVAAGAKADRAAVAANTLKGSAQTGLNAIQATINSAPSYVRADKVVADQSKRNKTLLGVAATLGLGATGYGYMQYKRDKENGQLAGYTPQVS